MRLKLRAKHGGRLELLTEDGTPVEGVRRVVIFAREPDFVPEVEVFLDPSVTLDVEAATRSRAPHAESQSPAGDNQEQS